MRIQPRQNLIEIFSSFLQWEDNAINRWVSDRRLQRNFEQTLEQSQQRAERLSEDGWALYWYDCWRSGYVMLAQGHLSAHLQEVCYWAAIQTVSQSNAVRYGPADCFQIAIADVPKILNAFQPNAVASLKTYSRVAFGNLIRDTLRREREIDICSDWSLVLKVSRKRLVAALTAGGLTAEAIDRQVRAKQCFEQVYSQVSAGQVRQRKAPDAKFWAAVADSYQRVSGVAVSAATIEQWITASAKRVREYLYPTVGSLNASRSIDGTGELQDEVATPGDRSVLDGLIEQEERRDRLAQQAALKQVLVEAIETLDPVLVQLLEAYYRKKLTQTEMVAQFQMPQYTISRRLTKARSTLLKHLARWSQEQLPKELHSAIDSNVLDHINTVMEEWLQAHYREL